MGEPPRPTESEIEVDERRLFHWREENDQEDEDDAGGGVTGDLVRIEFAANVDTFQEEKDHCDAESQCKGKSRGHPAKRTMDVADAAGLVCGRGKDGSEFFNQALGIAF